MAVWGSSDPRRSPDVTMATANVIITFPEVGFEVGGGEVIHQMAKPPPSGRGFLISVVTIGLGGQMGLSKGLPT
jgi:hypothetical protein